MTALVRVSGRDDMTDPDGVTGCRIEHDGPVLETRDVCAQQRELGDAPVQVGGAGVEQAGDVLAWRAVVVVDGDDLPDLCQGEPGGLRGLDEAEPGQGAVVVVALARRQPHGCG